jgi:two-component system, OmpR family, sensor histidine kinase KdpD
MSQEGYHRPDPDDLLRDIRNGGKEPGRGTLRVFFGMAAGCGKTYAMLTAARRAIEEGIDVVSGYIETHGRADIVSLAATVPAIPRRRTEYRGMTIEEMDLDGVLARRPAIALVDELAHTNAPDSRHPKRYQDVLDILGEGISVYTTLNVQHLESRADTVREITGVTVHETLPDSILEKADIVDLIDISPEDLRKRLSEGKIYPLRRAEVAGENFFEAGNLTALRELALRFTAEKVDHSLQEYRRARKISEPWKTGARFLVAVSPSPYSESLIRWTRRTAYNLGAPWIAVNVEGSNRLLKDDQERLQKHISLARSLGAEIVVTQDEDVTDGILRVARQRNITQIVAGKPGLGLFRSRSPIGRLIRGSGNIDISIVRAAESGSPEDVTHHRTFTVMSAWRHYAGALAALAILMIAGYLTMPYIGPRAVALILLMTVLIMALFLTRGAVFLFAGISALLWNFIFLPPQFTLYIHRLEDAIMFLLYFIVAMVTGSLTSRIRSHEKAARLREEQLNVLYDMTKEFVSASGTERAASHVVSFIRKTFEASTVLYLKEEDGSLSRRPHPAGSLEHDEKEFGCASYAFLNGKTAGRYTDTLPSSKALFIPLYFNRENIVGVMGIHFPDETVLSVNQMTILETLAGHLAMVIEREFMVLKAQSARIVEESDKLYRVMLDSVTHELKTPLAAIKGSISMMGESGNTIGEETKAQLIEGTRSAVDRLIRLVDNLLDMSRLEAGRLTLHRDWNDIEDIIGVTLGRIESMGIHRSIKVHCPEEIPLIMVDFNLIAQALHGMIHNAAVHAGDGAAIEITVEVRENGIAIAVEDDGPGFNEDETGHIFDKFYRKEKRGSSGGLGLGLYISKGIAELHGGTITAGNKRTGGAVLVMTIPSATKNGNGDVNG